LLTGSKRAKISKEAGLYCEKPIEILEKQTTTIEDKKAISNIIKDDNLEKVTLVQREFKNHAGQWGQDICSLIEQKFKQNITNSDNFFREVMCVKDELELESITMASHFTVEFSKFAFKDVER
jgi:hypothetical protein